MKNSIINNHPEYIIYSNGTIFSNFSKKFISIQTYKNGYKYVQLNGKKYRLHRLVAEHFIPNPENKPQVNHKNGNKSINDDWNLEWSTQIENISHGYKTGLIKSNGGKTKNTYQYSLEGKYLKTYQSITKAAIAVKINPGTLLSCLNKQQKTCANFQWSYEKLEFLKPIKLKDEPIKCALIDERENVIQKFQSISEAARILNLKSPSKIGNVISGKLKNYKGFLFKKI